MECHTCGHALAEVDSGKCSECGNLWCSWCGIYRDGLKCQDCGRVFCCRCFNDVACDDCKA